MKLPFWSADPQRAANFMDPNEIAAKNAEAMFDLNATAAARRELVARLFC